MRNIANFIKVNRMSLMMFYVVGFIIVVMMILLNNEILGEPLVKKWMMNSTVINHFSEALHNIGMNCFPGNDTSDVIIGRMNFLKSASVISNHYTQSAIMLPSIFIACCWIILSYVISFFKRFLVKIS